MAKKIEEKNPVGRPRLADAELIKDSWCRVGASLAIAFTFAISGIGVLTARTPFEVLTFRNPSKIQGNVANVESNTETTDGSIVLSDGRTVKIVPAKKIPKRVIDTKGNVKKIIPANPSN